MRFSVQAASLLGGTRQDSIASSRQRRSREWRDRVLGTISDALGKHKSHPVGWLCKAQCLQVGVHVLAMRHSMSVSP